MSREVEIKDHITLQQMHLCMMWWWGVASKNRRPAFSSTNNDTSAVSYWNRVCWQTIWNRLILGTL